ncbi:hypothetical protein MOQ_002522 [Trypanosoma cruzi marinkellei]|uniref:Uncharacterized protein n=1 Tax=Trypanosoma cruzi marinkellei TaxID=85056 RepID=K2N6S2_TRYCR|nr:hypothetical protein MOQ_002522 [Trypanosoma cruzi marinkellei]
MFLAFEFHSGIGHKAERNVRQWLRNLNFLRRLVLYRFFCFYAARGAVWPLAGFISGCGFFLNVCEVDRVLIGIALFNVPLDFFAFHRHPSRFFASLSYFIDRRTTTTKKVKEGIDKQQKHLIIIIIRLIAGRLSFAMNSKDVHKFTTEEIKRLGKISKTVVDDPSLLNHNLRQIWMLLGTVHHEKADQMMGTIIALHSSRMLSTSWTVLLQCLRGSSKPRVQLSLLRHFGNIVDRIGIPQRSNAFRVFAKEVLGILSSTSDIITNDIFLKSFCAVLEALGTYSEKEIAEAIFENVLKQILESGRTERRRAAALMVAQLVASTPFCGSFMNLMDTVEMKSDLLGSCITLDASLPLLISQAKKLSSTPFEHSTVSQAKLRIEKWLLSLLFEEPLQNLIVPVAISCYGKMKQWDFIWQLSSSDKIIERVCLILSQKETRPILILPLLNLIELVKPHWTSKLEMIWKLVEYPDPMVRSKMLSAIAASVNNIDIPEAKKLLSHTYKLFKKYMKSQCGCTVSGTLCLLTALAPIIPKDIYQIFFHVLHFCLDFTNPLHSMKSVQMHLLELIQKIPIIDMSTFSYVLQCTQDLDKKINDSAYILLLKWCNEFVLDEVFFREPFFRGVNFFEGCPYIKNLLPRNKKSCVSYLRNVSQLILFLIEKLEFEIQGSTKQHYHYIQCVCEGLCLISVSSINNVYYPSTMDHILLEETFYKAFNCIQDILFSMESFPFDVYISLIRAATLCLRRCKVSHLFDIFTHKCFFNYIWNVLYRCCKALDPISIPLLKRKHSLYLVWQQLPNGLEKMISLSTLSGLTNAKHYRTTHFFELVEHVSELFLELLLFGGSSPVFISHLRCLYSNVLCCLDILAGYNPVVSLKGCRAVLMLLLDFNNENNIFSQSDPIINNESEKWIPLIVKNLTRSLDFDLACIGKEFFGCIKLFIQADTCTQKTQFYLAVDTDFLLVKRMISIVSNQSYYNAVYGATMVEPILDVLELIMSSIYASRVADICGEEEWRNILYVIDESNEILEGDAFSKCRDIVVRILNLKRETDKLSIPMALQTLDGFSYNKNSCSDEFFSEFYMFCDAISLGKYTNFVLDPFITEKNSFPLLLCACVLDPSLATRAVESVLTIPCEEVFLEILLIILENMHPNNKIIEKANFVVNEAVLGLYDDLLAHIIDSFPWGWTQSTGSLKTMEFISDERCSISLRRALYDAARSNFLEIPEGILKSASFLQVAFYSFPQFMVPVSMKEGPGSIVSLFLISKALAIPTIKCSLFMTNKTFVDAYEITEEKDLSAVMPLLPLLIFGISQSPGVFFHFIGSKNFIMAELLESVSERYATDIFFQMGKLGLLAGLKSTELILLTKLLIRGGVASLQVDRTIANSFLNRIIEILHEISVSDEWSLSLRYCSMFLLVLVAPTGDDGWQEVLDGKNDSDEGKELQNTVLTIINQCLEVDFKDVESIAKHVVSIFLCSLNWNQGMNESVLWLVVKCCRLSVWQLILYGKEKFRSLDMPFLKFLCKLNQTVGLPPSLVQEMHANFIPHFLKFGVACQFDGDEQRMIFWFVTSLLLHTVVSDKCYSKPKVHMALVDALSQYADFPLEIMFLDTTSRIYSFCNASVFSLYARLPFFTTARNWNIHTVGHLFPLSGRDTYARDVAEKMIPSLLYLYVNAINSIFATTSTVPSYCVSDIYFLLTTLISGNLPLLKHFQMHNDAIAAKILPCVYTWYREYAASCIDNAFIHHNILCSNVGLLPDSNRSIILFDEWNTCACTTIMLTLFTAGSEKLAGYVDAVSILRKMLSIDIFSYMGALTAAIAMSGSSTRKEIEPVAFIIIPRLFDDLESSQWGGLSLSFGILQMLRSACSILSMLPEELVSMKVCEAVCNEILNKTCGRRLEQYAYYTLQCITRITALGQANWYRLRGFLGLTSLDRGRSDITVSLRPETCVHAKPGFSKLKPCAAVLNQAPLSYQRSAFSGRIKANRNKLLHLVTAALLVFRGSYNEFESGELDYNRIQVIAFLDSLHGNSSNNGDIAIAVVHELIAHVLDKEEILFITINKFDFTLIFKRLLLYELHAISKRIVRENTEVTARWSIVEYTTRLLFEACLGKDIFSSDGCCWWWLVSAILNTFLGVIDGNYSSVITVVLLLPPELSKLRMLAVAMAYHLFQVSGCGSELKIFLSELKTMCRAWPLEERSVVYASEILSVLLQVLHT